LLALAAALAAAGPAWAHKGEKAEPRIAAGVSAGPGLVRVVTVRLTDLDEPDQPIGEATVVAYAEMSQPHAMRSASWRLAEGSKGIYRAKVKFPMRARWTLHVAVSGKAVVPAASQLSLTIERASARAAAPVPAGVPDLTTLPTRLEDTLAQRDLLSMAVLWIHSSAAMGWIIGVLAMLIALSAGSGVFAAGWRERVAAAYRRWGAWVHWSLVPVIVATGIYNMLYVTPFPLRFGAEGFERLRGVPYGALYEAILIVKLGLFAALLVTGTTVLLRTVYADREPTSNAGRGFVRAIAAGLGPAGIFYLATIPLIIAAAMALRYVHILSHVAEIVSGG
jgi:hypothetical protein